MSGNGKDVLDGLRRPVAELRHDIGEVFDAYSSLHRAAMGEGELPVRVKELIALAIAVTKECDGCIASHARGAARHGATRQEVSEALGVAIMMNGGPGTVYGPRALDAFLEYSPGQSTPQTNP